MPRRVYYNISAFACFKKRAGRVNRYPLRTLVFERVEQKRVLKRARIAPAHFFYLFELALRERIRVREQPADNRAFAVVNMTDYHYI
jgi:hypothetical protein